jgi:hypothetical protein
MNDGEHFFIDAWCPVDGVAFVSRRHAEFARVKQTVYVAPPFFEPEPIASIATALAATHGHFQLGFYDQEQEIAFDNLDEVILTIRRVYLGGGSETLPPGEPALVPVLPPDEPPGGVMPEELVSPELSAAWNDLCRTVLHGNDVAAATIQGTVRRFIDFACTSTPAMPSLYVKFALKLFAPILRCYAQMPQASEIHQKTLLSWRLLLRKMGLFVHIDLQQAVLTVGDGGPQAFQYTIQELKARPFEESFLMVGLIHDWNTYGSLSDLIFTLHRTPLPGHWGSLSNPAAQQIPNLGALLALVLSDRLFWANLHSPLDFVPIVFAAMAHTAPSFGKSSSLSPHLGTSDGWEALKTKAVSWLSTALPCRPLRPSVEKYIHEFTDDSLKRWRYAADGTLS